MEGERERVKQTVESLLRSGFLTLTGDVRATIADPLPVQNPSGGLHSWFVPLISGTKVAAFAQVLPSLALLRFSSFQRNRLDLETCPEAAGWVDPAAVKARASQAARLDERLSDPLLTYDRDPSRLAWALTATDDSGHSRRLFVAGDSVYEDAGANDVFG